ncbi:hypothetical protein [Nocardioides sp. R-C-SC26]|nr:hypothetical protein [Nocardioides sp. R-C-SC26]
MNFGATPLRDLHIDHRPLVARIRPFVAPLDAPTFRRAQTAGAGVTA